MPSWIVWSLLTIVLVGVVAALLVLVARRIPKKDTDEGDVEVIGFIFAVVGVLYAIVLAFVVIDVWAKMSTAEEMVYREANAIVEQFRYAQLLPPAQRSEIQSLSERYIHHVIGAEWPAMREHRRPGLDGYTLADQLRTAIEQSRPVIGEPGVLNNSAAQLAYENAVKQGDTLAEAREARLAAAVEGLPHVIWFVLIGGGLLMIGFAYVFNVAGAGTQMILASGLSVMTVLLLWAVFQMEYPFARHLRVDPDAFEFALARFAQITRGG